ncbi:AMP-binding protein [Eleftheria terrae]|uniref:AMP-binding protein n=1 Tax=Eleftheria terrae TaxID=1597781 RepID=UPI00263AE126|nr:AMP-binding protein [Eleftheria terrae]WKB55880.1 AMP-binding protein [Eleftheria terrae]
MNHASPQDQLQQLGRQVLGTEAFGPGASMASLGAWTSLKHVQLLGRLAEAFDLDIELEEAYRLDSFERLLQYIEQQSEAPAPAAADAGESTIGALFAARAQALPEAPFLIFPKEDSRYTYRGFHQLASAAAARLSSHGLRRGERLCVVMPNGPEFLAHYFAAHLLGLVLVPINPALTAAELAYIVRDSGARLALFDRQLAAAREAAAGLLDGVRLLLADATSGHGIEALQAGGDTGLLAPAAGIAADDPAGILYTSGTTGHPKGVVLSHRNFLADAAALAQWFGFEPGTRTMCILPMFHNNGQVITLLSPLQVGGSSVILEGRSALMSFWKMIDQHQVHWTSVMPAFLSTFLEFGLKRTDQSLRGIVCGGQVLLEEMRNRFEARYQVPVFEGYGLTETTSFSTMNRHPAALRRSGSIGVALPCNEMKVVDEDGRTLPPGQTGEILIRGGNVTRGYHHLPEVTERRLQDGWLHTGDHGWQDAEGHFYFATRLDDLIIKGGENIYPAEVENALHGCADVVECAAFGIADALLGQEVCLYVKLVPGSTLGEDDIRRLCGERIARYKCPGPVVLLHTLDDLPELPKGPTRKILRRALREHYEALLQRRQQPEPAIA